MILFSLKLARSCRPTVAGAVSVAARCQRRYAGQTATIDSWLRSSKPFTPKAEDPPKLPLWMQPRTARELEDAEINTFYLVSLGMHAPFIHSFTALFTFSRKTSLLRV